MQTCWRSTAGRMSLQTSGSLHSCRPTTCTVNTLASGKPRRLRTHLTNTDALSSWSTLKQAGGECHQVPSLVWIHSYTIVVFVGLHETLDFSFSVEMFSSAADKSFLCFPKSLQNLEKQLQSWTGTAGFFYFGGVGGAREATGDRGRKQNMRLVWWLKFMEGADIWVLDGDYSFSGSQSKDYEY